MPGVPRSLDSLERLAATSPRAACTAASAVPRSAMVALALCTSRTNSCALPPTPFEPGRLAAVPCSNSDSSLAAWLRLSPETAGFCARTAVLFQWYCSHG